MLRLRGAASLFAWSLLGCGGGTLGGGPGTALGSACAPSTDYLKCDGNAVLYCACTKQAQTGTDLAGQPIYLCEAHAWATSSVCAVACDTTINPSTGCIGSTQPVPECAADGFTCWNGNFTVCVNGYPLPTTPCADGTECTLVPGCQALCLSSTATTDPRCPAQPGLSNDFCADNVAYHCACGYLTGTEVCGPAPSDCVTVPSYDPYNQASGLYAECGLPP